MNTKEHALVALWREAGYASAAAFAKACHLSGSDISRIVSPNSTRRPPARHIQAIALALGKSRAEITRVVLPEGDPDSETLREVLDERDGLVRELAAVRQDLLEARAAHDAAGEHVKTLTRKVGDELRGRQIETDTAARAKAALAAVQGELAATRKLLAEREVERGRMQQELERQRQLVERTREEAGKELARAVEQVRGLQDDANKERVRSVERQILSGALGAIAGAMFTGSGKKQNPRAGTRGPGGKGEQ